MRVHTSKDKIEHKSIQIDSPSCNKQQKGTNQMAHIVTVMTCPKPIPKINLVPRPKHNTAFVGFTRVNNEGEHNDNQRNTQINQSIRMEQNIHRRNN
ncbi:hypothetical protein TNCV_1310681 [Trichonephila clavipes]|nr:hypothetical protein TNCV_1310681 [Trichonephila clavipes]